MIVVEDIAYSDLDDSKAWDLENLLAKRVKVNHKNKVSGKN